MPNKEEENRKPVLIYFQGMNSPKEFSFWCLHVQQMCVPRALSLAQFIHPMGVSRKMHFNTD
jgi:hypothetical protein